MANQNGRPVAPARKLVATVVGAIAVFVMLFGAGLASWAIVGLGVVMLIVAVALGMLNVTRRAARAWISGSAQVRAVSDPPATAAYGRAEIHILVMAPGLPTSEVTVRDPRVPVAKWPRIGDMLPITVDVDDMRRVRIDWDDADVRNTAPEPATTFYPEDLPDDDLLGGEPEPPPWLGRDRTWGRGPDEPPPPPPTNRTVLDDDIPPPPPPQAAGVIVREDPGGPILEGQLVDGEDPYSRPLPQRARTATATATAPPPAPPRTRPSPRPRPSSAAPVSPAAAASPVSAPPASSSAQPVSAQPVSAPPVSAQPVSAQPAGSTAAGSTASRPAPSRSPEAPDDGIDLALDGDPEPAPETTPQAHPAVAHDILAPPAHEIPPPHPRSADDDLFGDLEPPPWQQRPDTPPPTHGATAASTSPIGPASPGPVSPGSASATGTASPSSAPIAPEPDPAGPSFEEPPVPPADGPDTPPVTAYTAPSPSATRDRPSRPKHAAPHSTGLAAAVAAGVAAVASAFRTKKDELRHAPTDPDAASAPHSPTTPPPHGPAPSPTPHGSTAASADPTPAPSPTPRDPEPWSEPHRPTPSAESHQPPSAESHQPASPSEPPRPAPSAEQHRPAPPSEPHRPAPAPSSEPHRPAPSSAESQRPAPSSESQRSAPSAEAHRPAPSSEAHPVSGLEDRRRPEPTPSSTPRTPTPASSPPQEPTPLTGRPTPPPGEASGTATFLPPAGSASVPRKEGINGQHSAGVVYSSASARPVQDPGKPRRGPWSDLEGGFDPGTHGDDPLAAYPSARPGPAGAIHGVGITVLVTNLERSVAFYRDMLGFYEIDGGAGNAVLASGDTRLVLRTVHDLSAAGRLIHLNLEVGDVEAVYDELKRKGVAFIHGPRPVTRGDKLELWAASFHDPDSHNIAITQWKATR